MSSVVCNHLFSLRGLIILFEALEGLIFLIDRFYLLLEAFKFISLVLASLDFRALFAFSVEDLTKSFATGLLDQVTTVLCRLVDLQPSGNFCSAKLV